MFLIGYSHSDLLDKVVTLHFNLHMHLAQGQFTYLFAFLAYLKNHTPWQLQLVLWHNAYSSKVLNRDFDEQEIWIIFSCVWLKTHQAPSAYAKEQRVRYFFVILPQVENIANFHITCLIS